MKLAYILFARMGSHRLANKSLVKINGIPLLKQIYKRLELSKNKIKIIIATSKNKKDDEIYNLAVKNKYECFRGDEENVIKRAIDCCKFYNLDYFIRVCGDRPFYNIKENDFAIELLKKNKNKFDLISNYSKKICPGKTVEIISVKSIMKIYNSYNPNKEHITSFYYENNNLFNILSIHTDYKNSKFSFALDTNEDLKRTRYIYKNIKKEELLSDFKILELTKKWYLQNEK